MLGLKLIYASKRSPRQGKTNEHVDMEIQKCLRQLDNHPKIVLKAGPNFSI